MPVIKYPIPNRVGKKQVNLDDFISFEFLTTFLSDGELGQILRIANAETEGEKQLIIDSLVQLVDFVIDEDELQAAIGGANTSGLVYDLRNGNLWVNNGFGVYSISGDTTVWDEILPRSILFNARTKRLAYVNNPGQFFIMNLGLSQDLLDALQGTEGTPSDTNRFVTNDDPRLLGPDSMPTLQEVTEAGNITDRNLRIPNAINSDEAVNKGQLDAHSNRTDNPHEVTKEQVGLGNVDNTSDADKPVSTAQQTALDLKINLTEKGVNNGVAPLDAGGKIPAIHLPESLTGAVIYQGTWNADTNTPALPDPTTVQGNYYVVETAGTQTSADFEGGSLTFAVGDWVISNGTVWQKVGSNQNVSTVFGRTGNILAVGSDYADFYVRYDEVQTLSAGEQTQARDNINAQSKLSQDVLDALLGSSGTPSTTNKYVTEQGLQEAIDTLTFGEEDVVINAGLLIVTSPTAATLTGAQWRINNINRTFTGNLTLVANDAVFNRIDIVVGNADGSVTYISGTASASPAIPTVPAGSLLLQTILRNANGTNIVNPENPGGDDQFSGFRYTTGVVGALGEYAKIWEQVVIVNQTYQFQIAYNGFSFDYAAGKPRNGFLFVSFLTEQITTSVFNGNVELITADPFSQEADFKLVQIAADRIGLFVRRSAAFMRMEWRVIMNYSTVQLSSFLHNRRYEALPAGNSWNSIPYAVGEGTGPVTPPDQITSLSPYDPGTTYSQGMYVSYDGNIWLWVNPTPGSTLPGIGNSDWELTSLGQYLDSIEGENVGLVGVPVYKGKVANKLQFRKIVQGTNMQVILDGDTIRLNSLGGGSETGGGIRQIGGVTLGPSQTYAVECFSVLAVYELNSGQSFLTFTPPTGYTDQNVKSNPSLLDYQPQFAFDLNRSLTGSPVNNAWRTNTVFQNSASRIVVDLGSEQTIKALRYQNFHDPNAGVTMNTQYGVKDFTLYGSNDASDFNPNSGGSVTNTMNIIFTGQFAQKSAVDVPEIISIGLNNTSPFRYYVFFMRTSHQTGVTTTIKGIRRLEFQIEDVAANGYIKLNEHQDYEVIRQNSADLQTHTIRRIKSGIRTHVIEVADSLGGAGSVIEGLGLEIWQSTQEYDFPDYVSWNQNIWKFIGASPNTGTEPGTPGSETVWELTSIGQFIANEQEVEWANILNKPAAFPPEAHTHVLSDLISAGVPNGWVVMKTDNGWEAQELPTVGEVGAQFGIEDWDALTAYAQNDFVVHEQNIWRLLVASDTGTEPGADPSIWELSSIGAFVSENSGGFIEKAFSSVIQLDKNYYTVHTIAGAIAFTYNSASNRLINKHIFFLTADGTNKPTFSNDFEIIWDNWMNDNGAVNRIEFEQANNKVLVHMQYILQP